MNARRWRNWRNNTTVRGELWRVLKYKCYLLGIRLRDVPAEGTTHTCPHCHQPAHTYRSPARADRTKAGKWEPWLICRNPACLWNGARDYAASLNIARLGLASLVTYHHTRRYVEYRMTASKEVVKPVSYTGAGATLLLPSQGLTTRPTPGEVCLLLGMESFRRFTHVSTQKDPGIAFDLSCQKAGAASCASFPVITHVGNGSMKGKYL